MDTTIVKLTAREIETVIKEYYTSRGVVVERVDFTVDTNAQVSAYSDLNAIVELNVGRIQIQNDGHD